MNWSFEHASISKETFNLRCQRARDHHLYSQGSDEPSCFHERIVVTLVLWFYWSFSHDGGISICKSFHWACYWDLPPVLGTGVVGQPTYRPHVLGTASAGARQAVSYSNSFATLIWFVGDRIAQCRFWFSASFHFSIDSIEDTRGLKYTTADLEMSVTRNVVT